MESHKAILIGSGVIAGALVIFAGVQIYLAKRPPAVPDAAARGTDLQAEVLPPGGVTLPVVWGDLGKRLVASGAIDEAKFEALYAAQGGIPADMRSLLASTTSSQLVITSQNAPTLLNLLWAFGLANKNPILEKGPMRDPQYGGAGGFASTGGWTVSRGNAMDHYSMHSLVTLTPEQQTLVEKVAKNIYRPCCGNSTYFPDCNHGMAMLGLLEIMAGQGATEQQMYRTALTVNSYWFPQNYMVIAQYLQSKGIDWNSVEPEDVLGANYSSAQGYAKVLAASQTNSKQSSGSSCGV